MSVSLDVPYDNWTLEHLLALLDDVDWRRWEILDGALLVTPTPDVLHESVSEDLRAMLRNA